VEQIHCIGASLVAISMNKPLNRRSNATLDHTSQVVSSLRQRCLSLATYCCVPYIVHDASREKQLLVLLMQIQVHLAVVKIITICNVYCLA